MAVPYLQGVVLAVLRASTALTDTTTGLGAGVGSQQPHNLDDRLPYVVASRAPGGSAGVDMRFEDTGRVVVDAYAADPRAALEVALAAQAALVAAQRAQTVTADGWLTRLVAISTPALLDQTDLPVHVHRAQGLYVVSAFAAAA